MIDKSNISKIICSLDDQSKAAIFKHILEVGIIDGRPLTNAEKDILSKAVSLIENKVPVHDKYIIANVMKSAACSPDCLLWYIK